MYSHAHAQWAGATPALRLQGSLGSQRGNQRIWRPREGRKDPIPGALDDDACMCGDSLTQASVMAGENVLHRLQEAVSDALFKLLTPLVPLDLSIIEKINNARKEGLEFEEQALKAICEYVPSFKDELWAEVPISKADGKPGGDGFSCQELDIRGRGSNQFNYPDLIISKVKPTDVAQRKGRTYLIGDFKRGTKGIKADRTQYESILKHAANYGYRVAVYVTIYRNQLQKKELEARAQLHLVKVLIVYIK
jgi:hypothetical protein